MAKGFAAFLLGARYTLPLESCCREVSYHLAHAAGR